MPDIIDRIARVDNSIEKLPVHHFLGNMRLYAAGVLTRQQAVTDFNLDVEALTQAGNMADAIDAANSTAKMALVLRFEAVMFALEAHSTRYVTGTTIDKQQVAADAGF